MSALVLARIQFAVTTSFHFLFVPLTLGLAVLTAVMETIYARSGNATYKKMAQFWGKLFIINFALGLVTGIIQEFEFGMNWSEYARYVGDIFGAPLAIEATAAFFLESTFLGVWIFGWDRLSKNMHVVSIWLVAFATTLSSFWILVANSFMQEPVGYVLRNGRAEMASFGALLSNGYVWYQLPHTVLAGYVTAAVFVMGISAYHLLKKREADFFRRSFGIALKFGFACILLVIVIGHFQGLYVEQVQPIKMAAANAMWDSSTAAPLNLVAAIDQRGQQNTVALQITGLESLLAKGSGGAQVPGIKELQAAAASRYGPGNYTPPVAMVFWSFRIMILFGVWLLFIIACALYLWVKGRLEQTPWVLKALLWSIPLPYITNLAGWMMAEVGRQPWIVYGLMRVDQAVSPSVSAGMVATTLVLYTLLLAILTVADFYLLVRYARQGPVEVPSRIRLERARGVSA